MRKSFPFPRTTVVVSGLAVVSLVLACGSEKKVAECTGTPQECAGLVPGDDAGGKSDASPEPKPDGTDGTNGTDGTDGPHGWQCPSGEDKACAGTKPAEGFTCPFQGLSVTPDSPKSSGNTYNFTCTMCPGGTLGIGGRYKMYEYAGDVPKPDLPDPAEYKDVIELQGNYFEETIEEKAGTKAKIKGYYFCPDPAEYQDIKWKDWWNTVFVYTDVQPAGAFDIQAGAADLVFLGVSSDPLLGADDIMYQANQYWDPEGTVQNTMHFCRIGSTIDGRECKDPFAQ